MRRVIIGPPRQSDGLLALIHPQLVHNDAQRNKTATQKVEGRLRKLQETQGESKCGSRTKIGYLHNC